MDNQDLSVEARAKRAEGAGGLKLVFKGSGVKHLLSSGSKHQGSSYKQEGGSEQRDGGSRSHGGGAALSDSTGRPFSPSSAEASPAVAGTATRDGMAAPGWQGIRSVHGQPPGKQPHPDDRTPEAEAARARLQPQQEGAAAGAGAGEGASAPSVADAAGDGNGGATAGPRSVHGQPPGKQPYPDDPEFAPAARQQQQAAAAQHQEPSPPPQHLGPPWRAGAAAAAEAAAGGALGPRSLHIQPPGKQPEQIQQIAASAQALEEAEEEEEEQQAVQPHAAAAAAARQLPQAPWRRQQAGGLQPVSGQAYVASPPAGSTHQPQAQARPKASPAVPGADKAGSSRKRPASQPGEGGQRKKAATNGASAQRQPAVAGAPRTFNTGVPASLARANNDGAHGAPQPIRPMPGAPRSLQQRQQLLNGVAGRQPAGAPRPKQQAGAPSSASKPKQAGSKAGGSAQRKTGGSGGGQGGVPPAASQYKPGDVVWAKIGSYPWWPAQIQRPTADEHFKPKHAVTDLFCVFYGSNDYNWLPASALKPFTETHPDYTKHASAKNKALQRAIDEAWVYGVQRQRPDVNYGPYGGAT